MRATSPERRLALFCYQRCLQRHNIVGEVIGCRRHGGDYHLLVQHLYRSSHDSPLEGNGFEISVLRCLATANSVGAFISAGEWRLLERQKQLYRFAEADDRSGDSTD